MATSRTYKYARSGVAVGMMGLLLLTAMGCVSLQAQDEPERSTPTRPVWRSGAFAAHLQFMNGPDVGDRTTGMAGYEVAATYVSDHLRSFGLQPGLTHSWHLAHDTTTSEEGATVVRATGFIGALQAPLDAHSVYGFVAGRSFELSDELIIVCADLDALQHPPDAVHLGAGAAALVELAYQFGLYARYTYVPGTTLLFAVFSGARQDYQGVRDYLRHPLWPLRQTRAVLYLGPEPATEEALQALWEAAGARLHIVRAPVDTLETAGDGADVSLSIAARQAQAMAEEAHGILLREVSSYDIRK